ncbi:uncharacterized protein [Lepeophtheirus salmonis]|uniref:uncharacterized protein n=1 Tax=Lepeophtheirus salmonis TaxID=72036 RepID=UPI001AE4BC8A|nr:calmodulin-like [Lepeophtheirus salmonis]
MSLKPKVVMEIIKQVSDRIEVNERDIQEFYEAFYEYDKDDSGNISTCELGQVMRSLGANPTSIEIEGLINEYDDDMNGTIEFPEFVILMGKKSKEGAFEKERLYALETFRVLTSGVCKKKQVQDRTLPMDHLSYFPIETKELVNDVASLLDELRVFDLPGVLYLPLPPQNIHLEALRILQFLPGFLYVAYCQPSGVTDVMVADLSLIIN